LNCTPEFVRELEIKLSTRLGLDVDYETIAKHEKEQAEAEAKAQADAAQQQADAAQQAQDQMAQQGGPGGPPVNDNPFAAPGAKLPGALPGPATSAGQALLKQSVVHIDNEPFGTIDELVSLAQELLLLRPEDEVETPVDGEDGL
jgi:multidrug efflux pump subunit AcrA (membrane-fusion protein)